MTLSTQETEKPCDERRTGAAGQPTVRVLLCRGATHPQRKKLLDQVRPVVCARAEDAAEMKQEQKQAPSFDGGGQRREIFLFWLLKGGPVGSFPV
jgi:hypothetical protein